MKTNVAKLHELGIYNDIKKRTGSSDEYINTLSPDKILCEYSGWKLGDPYWWRDMKHYFDVLSEK